MADRALATRKSQHKEGRLDRPVLFLRQRQEKAAGRVFFILSILPVALVAAVTVALLLRSWSILQQYSLGELLSGIVWKPLQAKFGFWPFIAGTFWVTVVGVGLATPPCLLTAIYL